MLTKNYGGKMKRIIFIAIFLLPIFLSAQWSDNPNQNTIISNMAGEQNLPKIAVCPNENYYISWFSNESGNYNLRLQLLDEDGNYLFDSEGLLVSDNEQMSWLTDYDLKADSNNNAIITFQDIRTGSNNVFVYKISQDGEFIWGEEGLQLSNNEDFEASPQLTITNNDNAIAAWIREGSEYLKIMIQKINAAGNLVWSNPLILESDDDENYNHPRICSSGPDNFILIWFKETGPYWQPDKHIYAQKFDSDGNSLWENDIPITTAGGIPIYIEPIIIDNNDNGVYVSWADDREIDNILHTYVQNIDSNGNILMDENGTRVSINEETFNVGGSITLFDDELYVFWQEKNSNQSQSGIYGQKLSPEGERLWNDTGIAFEELSTSGANSVITRNSNDGVTIFYFDYPFGNYLDNRLQAAKINAEGNFSWNEEKISLSVVQSEKLHLAVSDYSSYQWVSVWEDKRNSSTDIFAQHINKHGELGEPLPVTLTEFFAEFSNGIVDIYWTTQSETNNAG